MSARFRPGDAVRVRALSPPGHVRTPRYCRGRHGVIERLCGRFRNPERLAYGDYRAPEVALYRVRFAQSELWPDYRGGGGDQVEIDVYEHWLEPAEEGAR